MDNNQLCPMCKTCREIQQHFLSCQDLEETWVNKLTYAISTYDTPRVPAKHYQPAIIIWFILTYRTKNHRLPEHFNEPNHIRLIEEQHAIGWNQLLKERWSCEWVRHFEAQHPERVKTRQQKSLQHYDKRYSKYGNGAATVYTEMKHRYHPIYNQA
jgi:hypothetical protein